MPDDDANATPESNFTVLETDMTADLVMTICEVYAEAEAKWKHEKDMATAVKKHLDENMGGTWHVMVGQKYGCSVAHANNKLLYMKSNRFHVLVFQSWEIDLTGAVKDSSAAAYTAQ